MKKYIVLMALIISAIFSFAQPSKMDLDNMRIEWWRGNGSALVVPVQAEYQALLDYATTAGYTLPSESQKYHQNILVYNLKVNGLWDLIDVLYVFATDAGSDFATLNWKDPATFQCSKINSPGFTVNEGFISNGTTSYLNTGWVPATNGVNFQASNAQITMWYLTIPVSNAYYSGARDGNVLNEDIWNVRPFATETNVRINSNANTPMTTLQQAGLYQMGRNDNSNAFTKINGNDIVTTARASTNRSSYSLYLGAVNTAGSVGFYEARRIGFFSAGGCDLSKQAAFYSMLNHYFSTL